MWIGCFKHEPGSQLPVGDLSELQVPVTCGGLHLDLLGLVCTPSPRALAVLVGADALEISFAVFSVIQAMDFCCWSLKALCFIRLLKSFS